MNYCFECSRRWEGRDDKCEKCESRNIAIGWTDKSIKVRDASGKRDDDCIRQAGDGRWFWTIKIDGSVWVGESRYEKREDALEEFLKWGAYHFCKKPGV